jgi:MtaA/CmuA family methyltransferase
VTSFERLRAVLSGEPADRVPNFDILMQFAAHFIGAPLSAYYLDHRVLVGANLAVLEAFRLDIVQTISDPYREANDLGSLVDFPADGLPVLKGAVLSNPGDLTRLKHVEPARGRRMADRLEAVNRLKDAARGRVPVMGWVEGALAEAATLRGVNALLLDLYERPDWVKELLEFTVQQEIRFAEAQVDAGADIVGLGDSIASQISPDMYREFALPYEKRIFQAVHAKGGLARLHICGNTSHIVEDMCATGAEIIDLDHLVDLVRARRDAGPAQALCGNFDPVSVMLQGAPDDVRNAVRRNLVDGGPRLFSAGGCEIPDKTPHENLRAQAEVLAGTDVP